MKILKTFCILLIFFLFFQNHSLASSSQQVDKISKNLRCLICQGQSVYDSQSDFALSMKTLIKKKIDELYNDDSWFENPEKHPAYKMIHDKNAVQFSVLIYKSDKLYKHETAEILREITEKDMAKWKPFNPNSKLSKKYGSHLAKYYLCEPENIYLVSGSPLRIIKETGQIFRDTVGGVLGASIETDPNYIEFPSRN